MFTTRGEDFFFKDDRKVSVGDCALFKPHQDTLPFIGIIRYLTSKQKNLKLGVNWLYRPAEVKLGKGKALDAAPNEIFYSFHTDKIPAASLLHPCKVAFLPKGVELLPGTPSFICRRVYDIKNKCLWWLTDPDYIDERHKEVNQLLVKTQKEMHTTLQSGSPKQMNDETSPSHVKTSSGSHNKRRKRDHGDHGMESSAKRDRSSKADDGVSTQHKADSVLKSEIANLTEKGGLVDSEGVEKLVKLMQPARPDKKVDLISRSMLVGAIAVTDKFDCLTQFLQLGGLPVLDEWLQDVHKGKIEAGKDGDKTVEEFLLVLLQALDKLPVNLQALQMCNIGRSVNHLRTHKHLEIQRKARSLVDTWKKRVEAEMNIIETKSGSSEAISWPSKARVPDGGGRPREGSSEVSRKSSVALLPVLRSSPKPLLGEPATKSGSSSPGSIRTSLSSGAGKDGQMRISVASDLPSTPAREEKSSGSSQSHPYSQTLSGKEDARSSTAGSMSVKKVASGTCRNRKSLNGGPALAIPGAQRETRSSKTASLHSASNLTSEKALDVPNVEGKHQKLIVKIPSRVRSPALSTNEGLSEDPCVMNGIEPSPLPSEKQDHLEHTVKVKNDVRRVNVTSEVNTESWQSNDFKDVLTGSEEGDVSPAAVNNEDQSKKVDPKEPAQVSKDTSSAPDAPSSLSARDDLGINLLATVAAGEMPESNMVSPIASPGNHIAPKDPSFCDKSNTNLSPGDTHVKGSGGGSENGKKLGADKLSQSSDGLSGAEHHEHPNSLSVDPQPIVDQCLKADMRDSASVAVSPICNENVMGVGVSEHHEEKTAITNLENNEKCKENRSLAADGKENVAPACIEDEGKVKTVEVSHFGSSSKDLAPENHVGFGNEKADKLDNKSSPMLEGSAGSAKKNERFEAEFESKESQEYRSGESISHRESSASRCQDMLHASSEDLNATGSAIEGTEQLACRTTNASISNEGADAKLAFDLNEGFTTEEGTSGPLSCPVSSVSGCLPASITVAAASKGPFVPMQALMQGKGELGWKGSATTSAFRRTEPRKALEMTLGSSSVSLPDATATERKDKRHVLDFDLNVADERGLEDMGSHDLATEASSVSCFKTNPDLSRSELVGSASGPRLELDLNSVVEANDIGKYPSTSGRLKLDPLLQAPASPSGFFKFEFRRGFDLNDGPVLENDTSEHLPLNQHTRAALQACAPAGNERVNSAGTGDFSSWYPFGNNTYSTITAPSVYHDTGNKQFTIMPGPSTAGTITPDVYHTPLLSSSPAISYPSASFQYPIFPFGTTIPLAPATFSSGSAPFLGSSSVVRLNHPSPAGAVSSHVQRPYMIGLSDGGIKSNLRWDRQGLDLNTGPGGGDTERRDEAMLLGSRQFPVAGAQALVVEQQSRMHHSSSGTLKRKEPEGSWDSASSRHKQSPWKQ